MTDIVLVAHDIRSTHNVGSLLRTAEGMGVKKVYLTGYTPYPISTGDTRLPHLSRKISNQISKTALGAEKLVDWQQSDAITTVINLLKDDGYVVCALEQSPNAIELPKYTVPSKIAIVLGREVEGIEANVLELCDEILEIPMFGKKESFNVIQATAMVVYHCRFMGTGR